MNRKNFYVESTDCVLCDDAVNERRTHLFFDCRFSKDFWSILGESWDTKLGFIEMLLDAQQRSTNIFFKVTLIAGCWSLWNHRNKIIFDNKQRSLVSCLNLFKVSVSLIRHRVKPSLKEGMQDMLDLL